MRILVGELIDFIVQPVELVVVDVGVGGHVLAASQFVEGGIQGRRVRR